MAPYIKENTNLYVFFVVSGHTLKCTFQYMVAYNKENANNHSPYLCVYMHIICANLKVGSMSTSSCIFFSLIISSSNQMLFHGAL